MAIMGGCLQRAAGVYMCVLRNRTIIVKLSRSASPAGSRQVYFAAVCMSSQSHTFILCFQV